LGGHPNLVIGHAHVRMFTTEKQSVHHIPDGFPAVERVSG
jgi:hypothetical protein